MLVFRPFLKAVSEQIHKKQRGEVMLVALSLYIFLCLYCSERMSLEIKQMKPAKVMIGLALRLSESAWA